MRPVPIAVASLATAAAAALVGWGLTGFGMTGPRAGARIATLVPQLEVTGLFLVGLPLWARSLRAEGSEPLRHALAATSCGARRAVWGAALTQLKLVVGMVAAGTLVWVAAMLIEAGPALHEIVAVRLLLVAYAAFGIGLGVLTSALCRRPSGAAWTSLTVLAAMAAAPFAVAPVIASVGARAEIIQASIMVNPWIITAGLSGLDILRMQWVYVLSPLGSLEVVYPALGLALAVYGGVAAVLLWLSVRVMSAPLGSLGMSRWG